MAGLPSTRNADPVDLTITGALTADSVASTRGVSSPIVTLTPGATVTADCSLGCIFQLTPGANTAVAFTNFVVGQTITLHILTSGTTTYDVTFDPVFGGGAGTWTTSGTDAARATIVFSAIATDNLVELLRTAFHA